MNYNEQELERRKSLNEIMDTGLNPYPSESFEINIDSKNITLDNYQKEEVNNIKLYTYSEANKKIRNYHKSKLECLFKANNIINELNFFSPDINAIAET